ncbi:MAG: hypothetical protein HUU50_01295 [Candidatus Brocadiae bacterium]|nr:hypothetical protein [Candidatus Brocadiia bacterium]
MSKSLGKKYLYQGMDWESFEEKLETLSLQQSLWDSFKNGAKKCFQFLGVAFLVILAILLLYSYQNQEYVWQKYLNPQETEKTAETDTSAIPQEMGQMLYEYHQQMIKHINQKYQEIHLQLIKLQSSVKESSQEKTKLQEILKEVQSIKLQSSIKEDSQEKTKLQEILKEVQDLKRESKENSQKYIALQSQKDNSESIAKEQKAWKDEIKKSTEQILALQTLLKEWQLFIKSNGQKVEEYQQKPKESLAEKTNAENIQMYHYRTLFPPSILVYLPQNYHKFFLGFQIANRPYTVKEKYYLYQNFIAKGWYQIRLENWYKREYYIKILYSYPFDLLPSDYKILELTADYSMPQNIKTLRSFPVDEILNTDPGYGFVELLKREF